MRQYKELENTYIDRKWIRLVLLTIKNIALDFSHRVHDRSGGEASQSALDDLVSVAPRQTCQLLKDGGSLDHLSVYSKQLVTYILN